MKLRFLFFWQAHVPKLRFQKLCSVGKKDGGYASLDVINAQDKTNKKRDSIDPKKIFSFFVLYAKKKSCILKVIFHYVLRTTLVCQ